MVNMKRTIIFFLLIFSSIVLLRSTEFYEKKLIVVGSAGQVHLDPDRNSPIIDSLPRGTIVYQASDRPFRKIWKYIYYKTGNASGTKSGYILAKEVRALFQVTKIHTIYGGKKEQVSLQSFRGHFWGLTWGTSPEEVIKLKGKPIYQEEAKELLRLDYYSEYEKINGLFSYYFFKGKLKAAEFSVRTLPANCSWLCLYENLKNILMDEFGQAQNDSSSKMIIASSDASGEESINDYFSEKGLESNWETEQSKIWLRLIQEKGEMALQVKAEGIPTISLAKDF